MGQNGMFAGMLAALLALLLAACSADETPTYRYRLTVEVDTPEGLRTGSSVIEVATRTVRPGSNPSGIAVSFKVRGEAAAVDLGERGVLFALLKSEGTNEWAARIMMLLSPKYAGEGFIERFDNMHDLVGVIELPRTFPRDGHLRERSAYPMLVTFGDLADPTSVARVDPDDLAASFGEGVSLRRITVEMTDDPVTTGIEQWLGWLPDTYTTMLDGNQIRTLEALNKLANSLSQGDFSQGVLQ